MKGVAVYLKIGEMILNALRFDLLNEQVSLVEEQDDWDWPETPVIDDCVENVDALLESIGHAIFKQRLVKGARRNEKENRRHLVETLEPFLSLWSLATNINESEGHPFDVDEVLVDTTGGFTRVKNIILTWYIALYNGGR